MSSLSLNLTALHLAKQEPVTFAHEEAFYVAEIGEKTLDYLARICQLTYETTAENELILTFFDHIERSSFDSLFFVSVIRNIPNLDIRDGYDDDLCDDNTVKRSLCGKIFDTRIAEKILFFLDELKRRGLALSKNELIYLEEVAKELPSSLARNAINQYLLSGRAHLVLMALQYLTPSVQAKSSHFTSSKNPLI
ncbi:MAG: hypothetical protein LLF94_11850 [Chlamydiales bacterium]|nr:hypothetical protein [Chlamydiales bacterium]